jgi:hypothetical protein
MLKILLVEYVYIDLLYDIKYCYLLYLLNLNLKIKSEHYVFKLC